VLTNTQFCPFLVRGQGTRGEGFRTTPDVSLSVESASAASTSHSGGRSLLRLVVALAACRSTTVGDWVLLSSMHRHLVSNDSRLGWRGSRRTVPNIHRLWLRASNATHGVADNRPIQRAVGQQRGSRWDSDLAGAARGLCPTELVLVDSAAACERSRRIEACPLTAASTRRVARSRRLLAQASRPFAPRVTQCVVRTTGTNGFPNRNYRPESLPAGQL